VNSAPGPAVATALHSEEGHPFTYRVWFGDLYLRAPGGGGTCWANPTRASRA